MLQDQFGSNHLFADQRGSAAENIDFIHSARPRLDQQADPHKIAPYRPWKKVALHDFVDGAIFRSVSVETFRHSSGDYGVADSGHDTAKVSRRAIVDEGLVCTL